MNDAVAQAAAAGDWAGARRAAKRAILVDPGQPATAVNLAETERACGDGPAALRWARRAAWLAPATIEGHLAAGNARLHLLDLGGAADCFRRCLVLAPGHDGLWFNLGTVFREARLNPPAVLAYRRAATIAPDQAATYAGIGAAMNADGWVEAAALMFRIGIALRPDHAEGWSNLGQIALGDRDLAAARRYSVRACRPDPAAALPRYNRALIDLTAGDFAAGWPDYALRRIDPFQALFARRFDRPTWAGEPMPGETLLVHAEQGLGDTLQFVRFLPQVAARAGRIILEVQPDLVDLLRASAGPIAVIARGEALPAFDRQVALADLPGLLVAGERDIPARVPYLTTDTGARAVWRRRLAALPGLKVGIAWAGNPDFRGDGLRSPRLAPLLNLFGVPGITYLGLQFGDGRRDLDQVRPPGAFIDLAPEIASFAESAAVVAELDLVISSCTSLAHLAGALGRPTWVLLSTLPDWRWMTGRDDSPWYPTARLFRQPRRHDWASVALAVRAALETLVSAGSAAG